MKKWILIFLISAGCRKNKESNLVDQVKGNYSCLNYKFTWSQVQPYITYDSVYGAPLMIEKVSDTSIRIGSDVLSYHGIQAGKYFFLHSTGINKEATLQLTTQLDSFVYKKSDGGMGGASGVVYEWKK